MPAPSDWAVAYDFDGTLIGKLTGALMPLVGRMGLAAEARRYMRAVHDKYVGLFDSGLITPLQYREWLVEEFELYVRFRLDTASWQSALSHVRLRPGAVELMRELRAAGVPQCVVSGAVADFIEYVLEVNGARGLLDDIYAARLIHDPRGQVVGYREGSLVHMDNKGEWSMYFAGKRGIDPERIVALGDSIGDVTLGHLRAHRIGVAEDASSAAKLLATGAFGEIAVVDDHLEPAATLIRRRLGLPL